ncbi:MAG: endonuclease MutS2, partial [Leptolyngbyaceae cyanobacterium SM1_3_5]|nr:endonuclease MutS2 [Leptolyngbyaceae cyanobacterium SM1_3_5]
QTETLELLEWSRVGQHLATFAATKRGAIAARRLEIPDSPAESLDRLAQTKEIHQLESGATSLSFDGIEDISDALERADRQGILAGDELLAIATTLAGVRQLRRVIDDRPELETLNELVDDLRTYPELEQEIHRCIDDRGRVADRANPKLGGIREQLRHQRDRIYEILNRILQRQANAIQESLITQRGDRFVIPVKAPQKDQVPGIVHDTSTSGATLYIEPNAIVGLGNQIRQLVRQEQIEEEAVRRVLSGQVAEVKPDLDRVLEVATTIDLATARSRYAFWMGANPPRFINLSEQGEVQETSESIVLRQLRHPLLVWQQQHEQGASVVPIDAIVKPHLRVVAITGPNTGGKTVTLKSIGLAMLMAKVGLFVPAREPVELPWLNQVLADIGDEQSLEQSLSTFSGHIRRISRILDALNSEANALVLLDEVGAGTDPSEGSALAIALLKHLADHARLTIATTHFGELKALKYQDDRFENASVEFNDVTLSPTYRLLWGIPGRSNALAIAQRLGLDAEIVVQAQSLVGGQSEDVNQVISGLENQRRQQEQKHQEAEQLLKEAERLYREVSQRADRLQQREQGLQQQQEQAVQQAIQEAKGEIAQVIRRLQKGTATGQDAQQATDALNQIAAQRLPSRQQPAQPKPGFRPKVGDRVRIPRLGQTAEVLSNPDDSGDLTVRFGLMKMSVALTDLESLSGEKAEVPTKPKPTPDTRPPTPDTPTAPAVRTSRNTIDLRGSRVGDAEVEIERAIATAQPGPLWIIHGHGTGKLKRGVQEFLQRHPQVDRFEPAEQADGGTGVTVAHII